jgi:hypothetical protein
MKTSAALVVLVLLAGSTASASPYRWPLADDDRTVTAHYDHGGVTDWDCGDNTYAGHKGTDIGVPKLTPVFAAGGGFVKHRTDGFGDGYLGNTDGGGFGNVVAIFHGDGDETIYGHLSAGTGIPALGATIACSANLAGSGTSGNSSGPHLHFETRVGVSETGSYYSGSADDPYAGDCGGPISFWTAQNGAAPALTCGDGTEPLVDDAAWVADLTIPDGTEVVAGTPFVKTWRLRNRGTTAWGDGYSLVHVDGPDFGATPVALVAEPGAEVDVSLDMVAAGEGLLRSSWQVARDGVPFGEVIWVEVVVVASPSVDGDGDGFGPGQDCDDADANVHPGAEETCDGVDGDCDARSDDELVRSCCDTGLQACSGGAWGACDVTCEGGDGDDDAIDGGCSAGGGAGSEAVLVLLAIGIAGVRKRSAL